MFFRIGQKVYHEFRPHPYRDEYSANGVIRKLLVEDGEVESVVVFYPDGGGVEVYNTNELEWTDDLGGYWFLA